jgi:hypothetical protein
MKVMNRHVLASFIMLDRGYYMTDSLHADDDRQDSAEQLVPGHEDDGMARSGWAGWLISGCFHVLMLLIMYGIYWVVKDPASETPAVRVVTIDPPPKQEEKPKLEHLLETKVPLDIDVQSDRPNPITEEKLPVTDSEREENSDNPNPKGREVAVADSEMGGQGAFMAIGAGGGSSGMFGSRTGGGRKRAIGHFGGTPNSEKAVDASLRWFKKHQSANGMWDAINFYKNCTDDPKCEPGAEDHGGPANYDVAMTGYALLCFLGAGFDHVSPNRYKSVVKRAVDFLLSVQKPDGYLGERNYENAIGTMALVEAYALSNDPALKEPAQKGINQIIAHQNKEGQGAANGAAPAGADAIGYGTGFGWDYVVPDSRNDSSVSGWNVMALKSAYGAHLDIAGGMEGAKRWLETVWKAQNPDWAKLDPYTGESRFPYAYMTDSGQTQIAAAPAAGAPGPNDHDLTCVGALCAVFLGHQAGDRMLETLSNYIMNHYVPSVWPPNVYYMYYNTLTMFQVGGDRWTTWNGSVRDMLVNAQRKGNGCFEGSWDWTAGSFVGGAAGRVLTTAYATLCLEVYYRYAKLHNAKK